MRPHPLFENCSIPSSYILGDFLLKSLSIDDLERDFSAVIESAADIKANNPNMHWPEGLTKEKNLIDLAWHQREFEAHRSFAWIIESTEAEYLGCLYVYPSLTGEKSADIVWWWRSGSEAPKHSFRKSLLEWLSSTHWPKLTYKLQGD